MAALAEHVLPLLLLVGLATRLSAAGLLAMTAVIQLLVYPAPADARHLAALLLWLMARGPAPSLDHWLDARRYAPEPAFLGPRLVAPACQRTAECAAMTPRAARQRQRR